VIWHRASHNTHNTQNALLAGRYDGGDTMYGMKSEPCTGTREIPEETGAECDGPDKSAVFDEPVRRVLSVSKQELEQMERHWKDQRRAERQRKARFIRLKLLDGYAGFLSKPLRRDGLVLAVQQAIEASCSRGTPGYQREKALTAAATACCT
jgi:hypothetical protein